VRVGEDELLLEVFGGDLIQRTGGHARGRNAQFLGLGKNLLVLHAELLRNVVDTNGHIYLRACIAEQLSSARS
jgi:hypothetical protein